MRMAAALGLAVCMTGICGCGTQGEPAEPGQQETGGKVPEQSVSSQKETSTEGYCFTAGTGITISVDMDIDEVKLPEYKSMYTVPSCTGEGVNYVYDYGAYEIETYPAADGKNRIGYIVFKNDMVATDEGIDLSMTKEDVRRVYGENCEESDTMISCEKGGMKLNFLFEGDNMVSIEYVSAVIG